jgi:hypothetical protein
VRIFPGDLAVQIGNGTIARRAAQQVTCLRAVFAVTK